MRGQITFDDLLKHKNGQSALDDFENGRIQDSSAGARSTKKKMTSTRPGRKSTRRPGYVSTVDAVPLSDDNDDDGSAGRSRTRGRKRKQIEIEYTGDGGSDSDGTDSEQDQRKRRTRFSDGPGRNLRRRSHPTYTNELQADDGDDSDDAPFLNSDLTTTKPRRGKPKLRGSRTIETGENGIGYEMRRGGQVGERQSGRSTRHQGGMQEVGEMQIYRSDSGEATQAPPPKPKITGAREQFKTLPRNDEFRMRHIQQCDSCSEGPNFAPLIYCQGCTVAYHKSCLGNRSTREHLVTKVSEDFSVLQCRRCVAFNRKKNPTAPDLGKCVDCREHGSACLPFRPRKTPAQEHKEREDNDGQDPIYPVHASRINHVDNVLFRCLFCYRAFHFDHLPSRSDIMDMDVDVDAEQRFREYSRDWKCKECLTMPGKVSGLIAWKPIEEDNYDPAVPVESVDEDDKAYLVKWAEMSYFRACWMPGAWVWGVAAVGTRHAFLKRDDSQHPKMRTEDAIPEDYLRADIVLDIKYTSIVDIRGEEIDKARIREVDKALVKYKGLGYEDAVWEAPPSPEDGDRWADFVMAYNDWVSGRYVRLPKPTTTRSRLEKARSQDFAKLEKTKQPDNLEGGELMKYQIEGVNWLYYKWHRQQNAILADEMGLGKTIQIIGFLATLVADWNCFPFLVVVPNSTCPNWRREVKRWAPSLRVVAYYGSRESRDLAHRYELFPEASKELRCHIVVTSYDAAQDENCRKFFRSVQWQGLIVDEGQRLKNDKNILYSALGALKCPFRILLTGTPLQNNQRELFNLLHFLDESYDAAQLEEEYADLDSSKITKLHDLIRPFFLRRTKAQVLTFLPPMAQIIVPVSMTIVQKKVYRTILAKNPELMKAIFSSESTLKQGERANLNNILMQLRRCLCHPFVYSRGIEDIDVPYSTSHRNLVDASSKLKLLEVLLPKLKERGHRVLIFSQFLDMLSMVEDFLEGMALQYQRLDGTIGTLQKQKRIDEFNAPDSTLFAFLLSTRAGGVGINLATADTVIILDPDFNPHQDIQALSRAHRIGQHKKVLCFQLVTRASAEERIMQMGRKKLALDHVLIQEMDTDDVEQNDLASILRHGTGELFEDTGEQDIVYDGPSVDRLLDRSHMEDTQSGADKSAETQFSFARVWANDQGSLQDKMSNEPVVQAPDPGLWANILKERERVAAEEAAAKADEYGRGRRARMNVDYNNDRAPEGVDAMDITPVKGLKVKNSEESDTDFQAEASEADDEPSEGEDDGDELGGRNGGEDDAKHDAGRKKSGKHSLSSTVVPPTPAATPRKRKPSSTASPSKQLKKPGGARGKGIKLCIRNPKAAPHTTSASKVKRSVASKPSSARTSKAAGVKSKMAKTGDVASAPIEPAAAKPPAVQQLHEAEVLGKGTNEEPIVLDDDTTDYGTPPSISDDITETITTHNLK